MLDYETPFAIAGIFVAIALIRGAITDIKIRRFPKEYWGISSKLGILFAFIGYGIMIASGKPATAILFIVASVVAALVFIGIGYRFGSGGDWRALAWTVVISPMVFFSVSFLLLLLLMSLALAIWVLGQKGERHFFERTIPWAVAICGAYCISLVGMVLP